MTVNDAQWRKDGPQHTASRSQYGHYGHLPRISFNTFPMPPQITQVLENELIFISLPKEPGTRRSVDFHGSPLDIVYQFSHCVEIHATQNKLDLPTDSTFSNLGLRCYLEAESRMQRRGKCGKGPSIHDVLLLV